MQIYKHFQEDINKEKKIEVVIVRISVCIQRGKIKHKTGFYNKGNKYNNNKRAMKESYINLFSQ